MTISLFLSSSGLITQDGYAGENQEEEAGSTNLLSVRILEQEILYIGENPTQDIHLKSLSHLS
jgi:hypothetical protein